MKTGAVSKLRSVYVRDPDLNLVRILRAGCLAGLQTGNNSLQPATIPAARCVPSMASLFPSSGGCSRSATA